MANSKEYPSQPGGFSAFGAQGGVTTFRLNATAVRNLNVDGSITHKSVGRAYVRSPEQEGADAISRLVWVPDGIVITPRNAANKQGWGLPPTVDPSDETKPGLGTPGGDFPFVVLSKYKHNNTPEYLHTVYSLPERYGFKYLSMHLNWPANYLDGVDENGALMAGDAGAWGRGSSYLPQFVSRWVPLLKEKKQEGWFCHRPAVRTGPEQTEDEKEENILPPPTPLYDGMLDSINALRASADEPAHALSRPIVGWTPDLAQATVGEFVRSNVFDTSSTDFRVGWQTFTERAVYRTGVVTIGAQMLYAGERPDDDTAGAYAGELIEFMAETPAEYTKMTQDYTNGFRKNIFDVQLQGQYYAEVVTFGTWRTVGLNDDSGAPIVSVFAAQNPARGSTRTTWVHPELGHVSVSARPTPVNPLSTKNLLKPGAQSLYYKQLSWQVLKEDDITNTHREFVLGAALRVRPLIGETPQDAALRAALLEEWVADKKDRELRYKASRIEGLLPPDDVCEDSEAGLPPGLVARDLDLRVLIYVEDGPINIAPSPSTTCSFRLVVGKAEDFLATREIVTEFTLPFNPMVVNMTTNFSEDGEKALLCVSELSGELADDVHGEILHFYELNGDVITHIDTSSIEIEVENIVDVSQTLTVAGECKLFGYYDVNELKWVKMKVDSTSIREDDPLLLGRTLYASLKFPGGLEWAYTNTVSGPSSTDVSVTGVVKHILALNPLHLDRAHWIEITLSRHNDSTSKVSAMVMRNMLSPEFVKQLYTDIEIDSAAGGSAFLIPLNSIKSSGSGPWSHVVHPAYATAVPTENFQAAFWLGGGRSDIQAGALFLSDAPHKTPRSTPLAPIMHNWSAKFSGQDECSMAETDDGYAFCALFSAAAFGFGATASAPNAFNNLNNRIAVRSSSMDLEELTGISDLSDNIWPLWSM